MEDKIMNSKEIEKILKEAGRYVDVLSILAEIINTNKVPDDAPVSAYLNSDGELTYHVDGKLVRKEASTLLNMLIHEEDLAINISHLDKYITSTTDIMLHDYALYLSHGVIPEHTIDEINQWQVLRIVTNSFSFDGGWYIPAGWKRKTEDEEKVNKYSITKIISETESSPFKFIEEGCTCPTCGVIIDREYLHCLSNFNNDIKEKHSIKCPSCGNYGMNYMCRMRNVRMEECILDDLVNGYNIDRV